MLLTVMIPSNPIFHSLHQAINGASIGQAEDGGAMKEHSELSKHLVKEKVESDAKPGSLKGFGLGLR